MNQPNPPLLPPLPNRPKSDFHAAPLPLPPVRKAPAPVSTPQMPLVAAVASAQPVPTPQPVVTSIASPAPVEGRWSPEFVSRKKDKEMVEEFVSVQSALTYLDTLLTEKNDFDVWLKDKTKETYTVAAYEAASVVLATHPLDELAAFPFDIPAATIQAVKEHFNASTLADVRGYPSAKFEQAHGIGPSKATQLARAVKNYSAELSLKGRIDLKKATESASVYALLRQLYMLRFYGKAQENSATVNAMLYFGQKLGTLDIDFDGLTAWTSIFFPRSANRSRTRGLMATLLNEWDALKSAETIADEEDIRNGRNNHLKASANVIYQDFLASPSTYFAILSILAPKQARPTSAAATVSEAFSGMGLDTKLWDEINAQTLNLSLFKATLRPYQEFGVKFAVHQKRMLLGDDMGLGKALANSEPVLTPLGFKPMGDLKVNEFVIGKDGKPTKITGVYPQGEREIYKVVFQDGSFVNCDIDHLWNVQTGNDFRRGKVWRTLTTRQIIDSGLKESSGNRKYRIPMMDAVDFPEIEVPIDPYILGLLLGDGGMAHRATPVFSTADKELLDAFAIREPSWTYKYCGQYDYRFSNAAPQIRAAGINHTKGPAKSIPAIYKQGSIEQRLLVVQGLMDTDGWISQDGTACQFSTVSEKLAEDFIWMIRSLGGVAKKTVKPIPKGGNYNPINVTVNLPAPMNPFKLARKANLWKNREKYKPTRLIESIEFSHIEEATCIKVAATDELFVTRDFVVTHNTIQGLAMIAHLTASASTHLTHLVVAPLSVQENWAREIKTHTPFKALLITDKDQKFNAASYDIIVTTYERIGQGLASKINGSVVVDEAHLVKNPEAQRTQRVLGALEGREHAIFMTGTAIENSLEELTRLICFVNPELQDDLEEISEAPTPEAYRTVIAASYLRRNKEDVLTELPELTVKDEWAEMTDTERKYYEKALDEDWHSTRKVGYSRADFSKITRMREIIENASKTGEKVLVFSFYLNVLDAVAAAFPDIPQVRVDGSVDATTRQDLVDQFGAVKGTSLFISQIGTGGVGLNLQSASRVILCEPQIKASLETQAIARAYRMGQINAVIAHRLATVDTIDERIVELRTVKENLFDAYARDTDLGDMSVDLEDESKIKKQIMAAERAKHGVSAS